MKLVEKPMDKHTKQLFTSHENLYRTIYITAAAGIGKTQLTCDIIRRQANPKKTKIYWISSIAMLDPKLDDLADKYDVTFYTEEDVKAGCIGELFKYLKQQQLFSANKRKANKKREPKQDKYVKHFVVFDDVDIPRKIQDQQQRILLRTFRHLHTTVISLQQDFVAQAMQGLRQLYTTFILGASLSKYRLKDAVFPSLRNDVSYEQFLALYHYITDKPFHFFVIDNRSTTTFQDTFLKQITISGE